MTAFQVMRSEIQPPAHEAPTPSSTPVFIDPQLPPNPTLVPIARSTTVAGQALLLSLQVAMDKLKIGRGLYTGEGSAPSTS